MDLAQHVSLKSNSLILTALHELLIHLKPRSDPALTQLLYPSPACSRMRDLEQLIHHPAPLRERLHVLAIRLDGLPIQLATAGIDVHLVGAEPARPLPEEAANPEEKDDGEREVRLEEALGVVEFCLTGRCDGGVELGIEMSVFEGMGKRAAAKGLGEKSGSRPRERHGASDIPEQLGR